MHRTPLAGALLAALTATVAPDAHGLTVRTCGPDPLANTAGVLCAAPSGPCDAGTVVVSASITVKDSDCVFDLGGRALRVQRTLQVPGSDGRLRGTLSITNAGDITIAKHGRLKARGDLVRRDGIVGGGAITLTSSGAIRIAGTIDVSGDSAGRIILTANGDVVVERGAKIRGNGISSYADLGKRFADGGLFDVSSLAGSIEVAAPIQLRGANGATGGDNLLIAARNIVIRSKVDVSGGAGDGGSFEAYPGDDLTIVRSSIDARSRGGGTDGGIIWLFAGNDDDNDAAPGGTLVIDRAILDASGSANDEGFPGAGGWIETNSHGPVRISNVTIRADGATSPDNPDGEGGSIFLDSIAPFDEADPQPDRDMHIDGHISARGGRRGGMGGTVMFFIERDLDLQATIDVGGKDSAGWVIARVARDLHLGATLLADVERPHGDGGIVWLRAGIREVGALTVAADVLARAGHGVYGPDVLLEGCPVTVADGITIDARSDFPANGVVPPRFQMISGRPLQLGAGSRYLAGPSGRVSVVHPPLLTPVIGPGTVFDPPAFEDVVASTSLFPTCPRCGDGPGDACAPEVRIDAITADAGVIDATVAVSSPVGLPLAGDVSICDGTGIEELTFTVLAYSCNGPDPIELLVNDTVVATVAPYDNVHCNCGHIGPIVHTLPLDDVRPLLVPGSNRLGIRRQGDSSGEKRTYWAYATVTANGVVERVPLFDVRDDTAPFGTSHFDLIDTCRLSTEYQPVDAGAEVHLCAPVGITPWTGTLPCGIHLWPFEPYHDYTLVVRATDGVVAQPSSASRAFTRSEEGSLMLNGAQCPPP